jgi:hypothetical protein
LPLWVVVEEGDDDSSVASRSSSSPSQRKEGKRPRPTRPRESTCTLGGRRERSDGDDDKQEAT